MAGVLWFVDCAGEREAAAAVQAAAMEEAIGGAGGRRQEAVDRKQREERLPFCLFINKHKQNQLGFWNFLGLKTGARFFFWWFWFLASSIFFSLPKKNGLFFLVVLVSGFIDLSGSSTVPGDARSTLHTAHRTIYMLFSTLLPIDDFVVFETFVVSVSSCCFQWPPFFSGSFAFV